MAVTAIVTTLCTAGVAFYLRFLVALCRECKVFWIGRLARLQSQSHEDLVSTSQEEDKDTSLPRAA